MKILALCTSDIDGGAARAAYRLHKGLAASGVDSRMLVQHKKSSDRDIYGPQWLQGEVTHKLRLMLDAFPLRIYPKRMHFPFSPAWVPSTVGAELGEIAPDIVHLHWICGGFIPLATVGKLSVPVVWTLHDSWPFTGGCHIPFDCVRYQRNCGLCPQLGSSSEKDLSRWVWKRKHKFFAAQNMTIVCPSKWLADCAKSSSLFNNTRIEVIPNGIDTLQFKPVDKTVIREFLNLPHEAAIIAFGALSATSDRNKGFHYLQPALQGLAARGWQEKAELLVFGADRPADPPNMGLKVTYLGKLHDDTTMALYYAAADVFISPSTQENLSCTVMEALASGTPCVAFNVGGMPDMIEHKRNGYLATPFEVQDLTRGLEWVLEDPARWRSLSQEARTKVQTEFSLEKVARRHEVLYREIIASRKVMN